MAVTGTIISKNKELENAPKQCRKNTTKYNLKGHGVHVCILLMTSPMILNTSNKMWSAAFAMAAGVNLAKTCMTLLMHILAADIQV